MKDQQIVEKGLHLVLPSLLRLQMTLNDIEQTSEDVKQIEEIGRTILRACHSIFQNKNAVYCILALEGAFATLSLNVLMSMMKNGTASPSLARSWLHSGYLMKRTTENVAFVSDHLEKLITDDILFRAADKGLTDGSEDSVAAAAAAFSYHVIMAALIAEQAYDQEVKYEEVDALLKKLTGAEKSTPEDDGQTDA